jgi:hypothetical protein
MPHRVCRGPPGIPCGSTPALQSALVYFIMVYLSACKEISFCMSPLLVVLHARHPPQGTSVLASYCPSRRASQAHASILAIASSSCTFLQWQGGNQDTPPVQRARTLQQIYQVHMHTSVRIFCPPMLLKNHSSSREHSSPCNAQASALGNPHTWTCPNHILSVFALFQLICCVRLLASYRFNLWPISSADHVTCICVHN